MNNDDRNTSGLTLFRSIARGLSLVLIAPVVILIVLVAITPLTISGAFYLIGTVAVVIGIWGLIWGYPKLRRVLWLGFGLIFVVAVVRLVLLNRPSRIKLLTLPDQNTLCLLDCLIDEQDASLVSTRVLPLIGWILPAERDGLLDAMYAGYAGMAKSQALVPSPFVRTYLNLQHPNTFDVVVIEPENNQSAQTGLIFLHGFTGNFTMPCWLIAQAVPDMLTVCPSVGWKGDWWTADGEATLRSTIDYLHQHGVNHIYLSGLSNGGVGSSELAHKLTSDISGLILISGASPDAIDSGLPVLVLAGSNDERMPADMLHSYANHMGANATFVELPADHFMLAKNAGQIRDVMTSWLRQH